jgi:hypothetical protein
MRTARTGLRAAVLAPAVIAIGCAGFLGSAANASTTAQSSPSVSHAQQYTHPQGKKDDYKKGDYKNKKDDYKDGKNKKDDYKDGKNKKDDYKNKKGDYKNKKHDYKNKKNDYKKPPILVVR